MNWNKLDASLKLPPALPDHDYPESAIVLTAWWEKDHYWYVTGFYNHDGQVWHVNTGDPYDFQEMQGAPEYWSFIEEALSPPDFNGKLIFAKENA
jgi:hypothetical protein